MLEPLSGLAGCARSSFIDYPGRVCTVLFFGGCNLRCPYCHNAHVVNSVGETPEVIEEVGDLLVRRRPVIEGVVLSGGEPTLRDNLGEAAARVRSLGYRVKLDTNGLLPDAIERLAPDYLALDIKTTPDRYRTLLDAPYSDVSDRLRFSIGLARRMGPDAEVRITVAPRVVDRDVIGELCGYLVGLHTVYLQPMSQTTTLLDSSYGSLAPVLPGEIREYRKMLAGHVGQCLIRGEARGEVRRSEGDEERRARAA